MARSAPGIILAAVLLFSVATYRQLRPPDNYNVLDYGAIADDAGYDDAAILATFAAADLTGGTILFPPGQYLIQGDLYPLITKSVQIIGHGATLARRYADAGGDCAVLWPWTAYQPALSQAIQTNIIEDATVIPAASVGMEPGDGILIGSTEPYDPDGGYYRAHMSLVVGILDGDRIRIADPTPYAFHGSSQNVFVRVYKRPPRISIEGMAFEWIGFPDSNPAYQRNGLVLDGAFNPTVREVSFQNTSGYGIKLDKVYGGLISHVTGQTASQVAGYGYGIGAFSNFNTVYDACNVWASRHAFTASGYPSSDVTVSNSFFQSENYDGGVSFDTHIHNRITVNHCTLPNGVKYSGAETYFQDCTISNARVTYLFMNRGTIGRQDVFEVRGCRLINAFDKVGGSKFVWLPVGSLRHFGSIRFIDNAIINNDVDGGIAFFVGSWTVESLREIRLEGNRYESAGAYPMNLFGYIFGPVSASKFILKDNDFPLTAIGR